MSALDRPDESERDGSKDPLRAESSKDAEASDEEILTAEIDPELEDRIVRRVVMQAEQYSSPHPHPDHLERYAALYPKAPEIVFEQFREQGDHRRTMESKYMGGSERRANIGQWLAFSLVAGAIVAGVVVAQTNAAAAATIISVALGGGILLAISGAKGERSTVVQGAPTRRRSAGLGTESANRRIGEREEKASSADSKPSEGPPAT